MFEVIVFGTATFILGFLIREFLFISSMVSYSKLTDEEKNKTF